MARTAASTGIRVRHARSCPASSDAGRCRCRPSYEAAVPAGANGQKVRKVFPTRAAAMAYRRDALYAIETGRRLLPCDITVREAGEQFVEGMRSGAIRNRSGERYKPSVVYSYAKSLELYVVPRFGARKLSDLALRDV